jgi:LuxR family maltose regulon positive regulatory protein
LITGVSELAALVQVAHATAVMKAYGTTAAVQAWSDALAASTAAGSARLRRRSFAGLALAAALGGELCHAVDCGEAAEQLADEAGLARGDRPGAAPLALAWASCERLQYARARRWAALAQDSAPDPALAVPLLAILHARLLRSPRDADTAAQALEPILHAVDPPSWLRDRVVVELATLRIAQSRPDDAVAIVDGLPEPHIARAELVRARAVLLGAGSRFAPRADAIADDPSAPPDLRVDAALSRAGLMLDHGDVPAAVAEVRHAWRLAEPEQLRRPFHDAGRALRRLLRSNPALQPVAAWLGRSTSTVVELRRPAARPLRPARPARSQPAVTVEALTERETEVLRLLSELLSTEEIGAAMFVSVNTVRTHIRSILRKLDVSRRNEAVRRARELALV